MTDGPIPLDEARRREAEAGNGSEPDAPPALSEADYGVAVAGLVPEDFDQYVSEGREPESEDAAAQRAAAPVEISTGAFRSVTELMTIKQPGYNIDGILQQGTTALLWGLPGAAKTTHAIDWWARLALGLPWCGAEVTKGVACYLPLEDLAGFRARVDAWEAYNETSLPPWALWWDGGFDFSDECISAVRMAMEAAQREHNLPVVFSCIDPIMAAFGEGTALDEQDFRKRLKAIQNLMEPFPQATVVVAQHAAWTGKHELGSILQRALTATSIKAAVAEKAATLTIVRQKNDEEGKTLNFEIHPLGGKGRIVMVPSEAGNRVNKLQGNNRIAYQALVRAVDNAQLDGRSLQKQSAFESARCPVDDWKSEFGRFKSEGADTTADSSKRMFRKAKGELKALGMVGYYDNWAWFIFSGADRADSEAD